MTHQARRWPRLAALAVAGAFALPFAASAQDGEDLPAADEEEGTPAVAHDDVIQDAFTSVSIRQRAFANTGGNVQRTRTTNSNDTVQDSDATADGGDAEAMSDGTTATDAAAIADALAGFGGDAAALNDADSVNTSDVSNDLTTGAATADNAVAGNVTQTQDNTSTNTATAGGGGGSPAALDSAADPSGGASATSHVEQVATAEVVVRQTADANSGGNVQVTQTNQSNATDQVATSSGDGGDATAAGGGEAIATAGDGGSAASDNVSTSDNSSTVTNTMSTGDATSSNSSNVTVSQSSSSSSTNTVTFGSGDSGG